MADLVIDIDFSLETENLRIRKNSEEVKLDLEEGKKYFSNVPSEEVKFEVVSTNDDAEVGLWFGIENGKKGAFLDVRPLSSDAGLMLQARGKFSVRLRKGADTLLKNLGADLDLRLRAVTWKDGSYRGFCAPLKLGDYEQKNAGWRESFPKIDKFLIK